MANNIETTVKRIITTTESIVENYEVIKDDPSLPPVFRNKGQRPILVKTTFQAIKSQVKESKSTTMIDEVNGCNKVSKILRDVFEELADAQEASRKSCYSQIVEKGGNDSRVEVLMQQLMQMTLRVAESEDFRDATSAEVGELREAIKELTKKDSSAETGGTHINHYGTGSQFNNTGTGSQFNNTGGGSQYHASTMSFGSR